MTSQSTKYNKVELLQLDLASRTFGRSFDSVDQLTKWKVRQGFEKSKKNPEGYVHLPHPRSGELIKFPRFEYNLLKKVGDQIMQNGTTYWESVEDEIQNYGFFRIGIVNPGGYESPECRDNGKQWHVIRLYLDHEINEMDKDVVPEELLEFPKLLELGIDSPPVSKNNPVLQELLSSGVNVEIFEGGSLKERLNGREK